MSAKKGGATKSKELKTPHVHTWGRAIPGGDPRFESCKCGDVRRTDRISDNPCVQWWGRGPADQNCATCAHLVKMEQSRTWFKCRKRTDLTHSDRTDQRIGWEACARWEMNPEFRKAGS